MPPSASVAPALTKEEALRIVGDYLKPTIQETTRPAMAIVPWAHKNYYIPETKLPIELTLHQQIILTLMFDDDFAAQFGIIGGFQEITYSTVKKSGKTAIAGLIGQWIASQWGNNHEVYALANDLEQARGRIYAAIIKSLEAHPKYDKNTRSVPGEWRIIEKDIKNLRNGSVIRAVPMDYSGEAGSNPTATLWSELWGLRKESDKRLFEELTPVPTRKKSIRLVETYAGYSDESDLLLQRYKYGTAGIQLTREHIPNWPFAEDKLPIWIQPDAKMFTYWDEGEVARRMPWQTPSYYRAQAAQPGMRPEAFRRLHLNEWTTSKQAFVHKEHWLACYDATIPPIDYNTPMVLAADASVSGDSTGLVGITRHHDNHDHVSVRKVNLWEPTKHSKLDYSQTIEPAIRKLVTGHIHPLHESCQTHHMVDFIGPCTPTKPYNIVALVYDEYQLHKLMTDLRNEGLVWVSAFSQNAPRMVADKQLHDLIIQRKIHHSNEPELWQHLENAAAKSPPNEDTKLRIVKKTQDQKIDLAVCLSMASHECLRLLL